MLSPPPSRPSYYYYHHTTTTTTVSTIFATSLLPIYCHHVTLVPSSSNHFYLLPLQSPSPPFSASYWLPSQFTITILSCEHYFYNCHRISTMLLYTRQPLIITIYHYHQFTTTIQSSQLPLRYYHSTIITFNNTKYDSSTIIYLNFLHTKKYLIGSLVGFVPH